VWNALLAQAPALELGLRLRGLGLRALHSNNLRKGEATCFVMATVNHTVDYKRAPAII
jgi:hypothetical protein